MTNDTMNTPQTTAYAQELHTAIVAARSAGAMLRTEMSRPGGPRGHGGHAEIDRPAEELIRRELERAWPDDGFLGEETGAKDAAAPGGDASATSAAPAAKKRRWIVDPNDGTKEFLKGRRGPSVSIALVVGDTPVLGVVYAYAAPDDRGDLFAAVVGEGLWRGPGDELAVVVPAHVAIGPNGVNAENGGAATHTGNATPAAGSPTNVTPASVGPTNISPTSVTSTNVTPADRVLVSSGAASSSSLAAAYETLSAPWMPFPVPGIAYRLARVAAGDGRVATTLTAPWSWDMAGGHALLLAAGADLFTRDLQPVRYDDEGHCTYAPAYFGGRRRDVERIRHRNWGALFVTRPGRRREEGP